MSVHLTELGVEPIVVRALGAHVVNKNIGNGGNRYKKWEEAFLGEVYLQVEGRLELTETPDYEAGDRIEDADKYWVDSPVLKYPVSIKGWQTYDALRKDRLTVIPVNGGFEKPGIMKPARYPLLVDGYPSFSGTPIARVQTEHGLYYLEKSLAAAASILMWRKLGIILVQKRKGVDNKWFHLRDEERSIPSCGVCLHRTYKQPEDKPVSEASYEPCYFCAVTGDPIDDVAAKVANQLDKADHGLVHGFKGNWFLYGDKYVVGGKADDDKARASVRTGRQAVTMKDMREQSFMHHAAVCPWYAPRMVLGERAVWTRDLKTAFLPNLILKF